MTVMSRPPAVAKVAVMSPPFAALSYSLPEWLPASAFQVGQRVAVPLGKGLRAGVILELSGPGSETETNGADSAKDTEGRGRDFVLKPIL